MARRGTPGGPSVWVVGATGSRIPLHQNYLHVSALEALELGLPVMGRVVFTDGAMFPKGIPEDVSYLQDLRRDLGGLVGDAAISSA